METKPTPEQQALIDQVKLNNIQNKALLKEVNKPKNNATKKTDLI